MLRAVVTSARGARPETVMVRGEAGIGKSRLLSEAIARYAADDVVVWAYGVDLLGPQLTLGVVGEAVRALAKAGGETLMGELPASATTVVKAFLASESGSELEAIRRADLFAGFAALLETFASRQLVWLVVDDVQWADDSSIELLQYVARVMRTGRLLTSYTLRTDDEKPRPSVLHLSAELSRHNEAATIVLVPFDRAAAEAQVAGLADVPPTAALIDRILSLGDGNPFLTEQLVAGGLTARGPLPETPQMVMRSRVATLSDRAARMVEAASLAYGSFSFDALRRVTGYDEEALESTIDEAALHGIVESERSSDRFRFHHALLKEAVSTALRPGSKRRWHRVWAEVLEEDFDRGSDTWRVAVAAAQHWVGNGDVERAFDACIRAADLTAALHAPSERAPLLVRALALWDRVPVPSARAERSRDQLAIDAIRATQFAGDWEGALALIEAELRHDDSGHDAVRRTTLELSRQGTLEQLGRGVIADLQPRIGELGDLLLEAPQGPWLANGCLEAAWRTSVSGLPGSVARNRLLLERALSAARLQGDPMAELNAGQTLADILGGSGQLEEAFAVLDTLAELTSTRIPERVSDVEAQLSWYQCFRGDLASGLATARQAMRRIPEPEMSPRLFAYVAQSLAHALIESGLWLEAETWLAQARTAYAEGWTAFDIKADSARLACYRGDIDAAVALVESLRDSVPRDEQAALRAVGRGGRARIAGAQVAAMQGDIATVRQLLAPVWLIPDLESQTDNVWRAVLLAAGAEADTARRLHGRSVRANVAEAADEHVVTLRGIAARLHVVGPLGEAWTRHLAGELLRYEGLDTHEVWEGAEEAWEAVGIPHDRGWALLHRAECHIREGGRELAQEATTEAHTIAVGLGAKPLVDATAALAQRSRLRLEPIGADGTADRKPRLYALTERETEVLQLVALGLSNEQIASRLFISPRTASVHVSRILAKLGVSSRSEAAAVAFRHGLVAG